MNESSPVMKSQRWRQRLLGSTRGQILALLRTENRTVNELAATLNLTDNAVRSHLVSLERDGLVQQHGTRAGTRKPHTAYGLSSAAEHLERLKGRSRRDRIKAALDLLNDLGGSAKFDESEGKQFIHGRNGCPLAAVTATQPEACLIVESLLSKTIGIRAKKCCEYGEVPRCCFELSR